MSSKSLEEHVSFILDIVNRHYNKNPVSTNVKMKTRTIKKRNSKEVLYENQYFIIVKDFHSKDKVDIWVLKLERKIWLEKDDFAELKEFIECYDGYYSGFSGGFIFKSIPNKKIIDEIIELLQNLVE